MATISEMNRTLKQMADAANKRLGRMEAGQRTQASYYAQNYAGTIMGKGGLKFSKAAASSEAEARKRINDLRDFLDKKSSSKKEWSKAQKQSVSKAIGDLKRKGFNVTEKEFKQIVNETGGQSSKEFYYMLAVVTAAKQDPDEEFDAEEMANIVKARRSEQKVVEDLIKSRNRTRKQDLEKQSRQRQRRKAEPEQPRRSRRRTRR